MKHDRIEERRARAQRERLIRTAEWVLAQAYRKCTLAEMKASQLRVRAAVVAEMRRRMR